MIEVSFQGETHHCFANNPQSDAGSDTQDTNTMTSVAAASRQQNGGSTEQWESVPVSTQCTQTHTMWKRLASTDKDTVQKDILKQSMHAQYLTPESWLLVLTSNMQG